MKQFIKKYWLVILVVAVVVAGVWCAESDLSSIRGRCYTIGNTAEQCEMN